MNYKVCLLGFEYPPRAVGGLNTFVKLLEGGLVKRGVDVDIFLPSHNIHREVNTTITDSFDISTNGGRLSIDAHRMTGRTGKNNILLFSSREKSALNVKKVYSEEHNHEKIMLFAKCFLRFYERNLKNKKIVIHANDRQSGFGGLLVKRKFQKVPLLYTIHLFGHYKGEEAMIPHKILKDYGMLEYLPRTIVKRFIYKKKKMENEVSKRKKKKRGMRLPIWTEGLIAYYADLVNTVSRSYLRYDVWPPFGNYKIPKEKFTYIFNGMRINEMLIKNLNEKENAKRKMLRSLGLEKGPLFLNTGRQNTGQKGTDILVKSINLFLEENKEITDIRFVILAGGRTLTRNVRRLLKELEKKHKANVRVILGWVDDIMPYYTAADAYIMPSKFEPFGLTQIEAMCKATPVIGSMTGGIRDVQIDFTGILDKEYNKFKKPTGMLVSIWKMHDLCDRILEMYNLIKNNQKEYKKLQKNSLERAKYFTIERTADSYIKLYKGLIRST